MVDEQTHWGPNFHNYLLEIDPCSVRTSHDVHSEIYEQHNIPSLADVQELLIKPVSVDDPVEYVMEEIQSSMANLYRYMSVCRRKIFSNHYGFLCIRRLLHLTCLCYMEGAGILDEALRLMEEPDTYSNLSRRIAWLAIEQLKYSPGVARTMELFSTGLNDLSKPASDSPVLHTNISFLVQILWEDRGSFLNLCIRGLLPGCSVLLCSIAMRLLTWPSTDPREKLLTRCRELIFRLYLVGSNHDRYVLELLGSKVIDRTREITGERSFVDAQDSKTAYQAYSGLLLAFQQGKYDINEMTMHSIGHLTDFVLNISTKGAITLSEILDVPWKAFGYVWVFLNRMDDIIATEKHTRTRHFAARACTYIRAYCGNPKMTHDLLVHAANVLVDVDIIGCLGQILLMTFQPASTAHSVEDWRVFLHELPGLQAVIERCSSAAPKVFDDSRADWIKTLAYLRLRASNARATGDLISSAILSEIIPVWSRYEKVFSTRPAPYPCTYPRCTGLGAGECMEGAGYSCGRCNKATYCSPRCQRFAGSNAIP
ncbi:hypothetical protein RhiJN_00228 [Ceratobasidium sp. AG-Ba]|nr:hypothetical protein RhiJN_00228 [Ceratobasidium sp. AG-Ba]